MELDDLKPKSSLLRRANTESHKNKNRNWESNIRNLQSIWLQHKIKYPSTWKQF